MLLYKNFHVQSLKHFLYLLIINTFILYDNHKIKSECLRVLLSKLRIFICSTGNCEHNMGNYAFSLKCPSIYSVTPVQNYSVVNPI